MTQCVCGSYHTDEFTKYVEYVYRDHVREVVCVYTECQDCGCEFTTGIQVNENAAQTRQAQRIIDEWIDNNLE